MKSNLLAFFCVFCSLANLARAVEVDEEIQKKLGIEVADLKTISLPPETAAYASVISPAPVIEIIRQIHTAVATEAVSNESLERLEKLFADGELAPKKDVLAARAQVALDKTVVQGLEDRLQLEWGPWFSGKSPAERDALIKELLAGHQALVRVSVPRGVASTVKPVGVRLHAFGQEKSTIRSNEIIPALTVDASYQAQSWIAVVATKDAPLAVGLSLTGSMELDGKPQEGILVPQSAVVFYLGKAWVYQQAKDVEFERLEIPIDKPVDGGWFLEKDAIETEKIVTRSVQPLLSQETLGPAEEE
jgi:hypothetical protein